MAKNDYRQFNVIILIDGKFGTFRDSRQWVLLEWYRRKDKDGNEVDAVKESYFPKLEQVCRAVMNRHAGECGTLEDIITMMNDIPRQWSAEITNSPALS